MSRWLYGGLMAASLALASPAGAGERTTLAEWQLDGVTAGAFTAVSALSRGATSCCSGASGTTTQTDYVIGGGTSDGNGNSADASQQGKVRTIARNNFSLTVGVVQGQTETTGNGTASNTAQGVAEGDFTFTTGGLQNVGGTNRQFGVIIAVAVDNPLRRSPAP